MQHFLFAVLGMELAVPHVRAMAASSHLCFFYSLSEMLAPEAVARINGLCS